MIKKFLIGAAMIAFTFSIANAMDMGVVVLDHYECETYDHIVLETRKGYTTAQVYSGYSATYEGKYVYGNLNSYGFEDIFDEEGNEVGRIWIDDYMTSESTALEWCYEE